MTLSVSVAMCTFNGERYVADQLASVLEQDPHPTQVVVSDDGSTDGTREIVNRLLAEAAGKRGIQTALVDGPREGTAANFAHATALCTSKLIILSDQDDVWRTGRLAKTVAAFEANERLLMEHSDARLVDENGSDMALSLFDALAVTDMDIDAIAMGKAFETYLRRNLATGATMAFRRELLESATPFPPGWVHDEWLAIISAATGEVSISRERPVEYRQHGANQIGVRRPTLAYKAGRLFTSEPRRNSVLAERAEQLYQRLVGLPQASPDVVALAAEKAIVERTRAAMPSSRLLRVRGIWRLLVTGRYARFASQGNLEALRDLTRPVNHRQ